MFNLDSAFAQATSSTRGSRTQESAILFHETMTIEEFKAKSGLNSIAKKTNKETGKVFVIFGTMNNGNFTQKCSGILSIELSEEDFKKGNFLISLVQVQKSEEEGYGDYCLMVHAVPQVEYDEIMTL